MKRRVAILGSTGSIGTQALDVIAAHPDRFELVAIAAGRRVKSVVEQANRFRPQCISIASGDIGAAHEDLHYNPHIGCGAEGLRRVALESGADVVLAATDGFVAFEACLEAAARGVDLAVANKELLVAAGPLLMAAAKRGGGRVLPVDSEHSAIFQCLLGEDARTVASIILTASGGPFWRLSAAELDEVTLERALVHPTWQMGVKNTIDSATMMNKGLEMIEAMRLFDLTAQQVRIVVHPQSIAHGAVVFTDGSVKAQLAAPDMRMPIGYALAFPQRLAAPGPFEPLAALGAHPEAASLRYDFEAADSERFPCVRLAYEAGERGGTAPAALSAANEVAVEAFVRGEIPFTSIWKVCQTVLQRIDCADLTVESVREADAAARESAREAVRGEGIRIGV